MQIAFQIIHLHKRFPLAISRGTKTGSDNLFVSVSRQGVTGWGEMCPGASEGASTPEQGQAALRAFWNNGGRQAAGESVHAAYALARDRQVPPCALAALDTALWDLLAKTCGMPLFRVLGLPRRSVPTSVTIGINPPEVVRERVPLLLDNTGVTQLKIKLGSPEGIDADQAMFLAASETAGPFGARLRVDANGGWDVAGAKKMMRWLAERGVEYVEQPLAEGMEDALPELYENRPLPIFVDESCRFSRDIPRWAHAVDGVNLKLMKCGGITEALRIVAVARAFGLKTMIGCMSESSLSISAGAAIGALFDHIDLDSHLNLQPDPCSGATFEAGVIIPPDTPGHGASINGDG